MSQMKKWSMVKGRRERAKKWDRSKRKMLVEEKIKTEGTFFSMCMMRNGLPCREPLSHVTRKSCFIICFLIVEVRYNHAMAVA